MKTLLQEEMAWQMPPETALPMLAEDAMKVQRLLVNNPRDVA